jgi:hypothetical protein
MSERLREDPDPSHEHALRLSLYETIASRRATYDTMLWQAPVLSLTAQAFLFTIALGEGSSRLARLLAGALALITALGSMQLMGKQRFHEQVDSQLLALHERTTGLADVIGTPMHGPMNERVTAAGLVRPWYAKPSSYKLWMIILASFAVAAFVVILVTWLHPQLLQ